MPFRRYNSHPNNPTFLHIQSIFLDTVRKYVLIYGLSPSYTNLHVYNLLGCSSFRSCSPLSLTFFFSCRRFDICYHMSTFNSNNTFSHLSNLSDLVYAFRIWMYVLHVRSSPPPTYAVILSGVCKCLPHFIEGKSSSARRCPL